MRVHGMQFKPLGARIGKFRAARADFLPEIAGPVTEAYYIYPVELKNSKRIAVFRNFITQKIAESNF